MWIVTLAALLLLFHHNLVARYEQVIFLFDVVVMWSLRVTLLGAVLDASLLPDFFYVVRQFF